MKNRYISTYILSLLAVLTLFAFSARAEAVSDVVTNGGDDETASAPAIESGVAGQSANSITNGGDDVNQNSVIITDQTSDVSKAGVTNGFDDIANESSNNPPIVTPVVTPDAARTSSGGSYSSSSGNRVVLATIPPPPPITTFSTTSCPLLTDYLKLDGQNNSTQVAKLQFFLKNAEKLNIDVNGTFDQKTDDAVKAFQIKYLPSVLGPWGADRASGFVFITTKKKINQLACASPLTLSTEDQATIDAYKARGENPEQSAVVGQGEQNATSTGTLEVGTTDNSQNAENVAAVGGASIFSRFWDYIQNLFR